MGGERVALVGREAERSRLTAALRRARAGRPQLVVLEADPGMGKTRLLQETARLAAGAGFVVRRVGFDPLVVDQPFAALGATLGVGDGAGDALTHRLRDLLARQVVDESVGFASHVAELRFWLVGGLCELIERLARDHPQLIVLDDVQWADRGTLAVTQAAVQRVREVPLVIAVARRTGGGTPEVQHLVDTMAAAGALHLRPEPLSRHAVRQLVEELHGRSPGPRLRSLLASADGVPLLLVDLLEGLAADGALVTEAGQIDVVPEASSRELARRVAQRLDELSRDARLLLKVGSLFGGSFGLDDAAAVADLTVDRMLAAAESARRTGLVTDVGSRLGFRHDLVREAVAATVAPAERAALHHQIGRHLAGRGVPAARIAHHLAVGAEPGDAQAVSWLHRAALEAGSREPHAAVELLDHALRLVTPEAAARTALGLDRLRALGWSGRLGELEASARVLLDGPCDPVVRARVRRELAFSLFLQNRSAEAAAECEASAAEQPPESPAARQALADASLGHLTATNRPRASELAHAAIADGAGPEASCIAHLVLSRIAAFDLDGAASLTHVDEAERLALAVGDEARIQPRIFRLFTLLDLDRLDDVDAEVTRYRQRPQEASAWVVPMYCGMAAVTAWWRGSPAEVVREAQAGLEASDDLGSTLAVLWLTGLTAVAQVHRGDLDAAAQAVEDAQAALVAGPLLFGLDIAGLAFGLLAEARGDTAAAYQQVLGTTELIRALGLGIGVRVLGPDLVRLAMAVGEQDVAAATADDLERVATGTGLTVDRANAHFGAGLASRDPSLLELAADGYATAGHRLGVASANEHAGRLHWQHDDRRAAGQRLTLAEQGFAATGAEADRRRVRALFPALGVRRSRPRTSAVGGWGSLSDRERVVAAQIAEGATNQAVADRLGLSRRTVETHLHHAYRKLGIRSRIELAASAREHVG